MRIRFVRFCYPYRLRLPHSHCGYHMLTPVTVRDQLLRIWVKITGLPSQQNANYVTFIIPLNFCIGPLLWRFGLLIIDQVISSVERPIPAALSPFVANADKFQYAPECCMFISIITSKTPVEEDTFVIFPLWATYHGFFHFCLNFERSIIKTKWLW